MATTLEQTATTYASLIAADPTFEQEVWQDAVMEEYPIHDVFNQFTGGEGSGMPVIKKSEHAGMKSGKARTVHFTTLGEIGGQGVLDETQLTGNEADLEFDSFDLTLGLLRHSIGWTQVLALFRLGRGTPSAISQELISRWYGLKTADDKMVSLRNDALIASTENLVIVGGHTSLDDITSADTISTTQIENSKLTLQSLGFNPIEMETGNMGAEVPQALFFAPDEFLRPMKRETTYLSAIRDAQKRGSENPSFKGNYVTWDGNIIYNHNVRSGVQNGRLGTPLRPIAYLGTALADASATSLTGGGTKRPAGSGDYFANFPGYPWKFYKDQTLPTDNNTYYAIIWNPTDKKYEGVSYTAAGFSADGNTLTVTREVATVLATAHARYSNAHPSGSHIIPCTKNGVPLGFGLHMGQQALCQGTGVFELEQITRTDDYKNSKGDAHLSAVGIQAVRGFAAYQDFLNRRPNYTLVAGALSLPKYDFVEYAP